MAETDAAVAVRRGWLATGVAILGLVTWGSLTPSPPDVRIPVPQFDKLEHIGAYLLLTAWLSAIYPKRWPWIALGFALYGGAIEILQGYTGRDPDWFDWFADCVGAGLGAWYPARWAQQVQSFVVSHYARHHA